LVLILYSHTPKIFFTDLNVEVFTCGLPNSFDDQKLKYKLATSPTSDQPKKNDGKNNNIF